MPINDNQWIDDIAIALDRLARLADYGADDALLLVNAAIIVRAFKRQADGIDDIRSLRPYLTTGVTLHDA
jgi:hypothetical protein